MTKQYTNDLDDPDKDKDINRYENISWRKNSSGHHYY